MPKEADYTITWSCEQAGYEIYHVPFRFPLTDTATLHFWLKRVDAVHFCSQAGHDITLRKERKQRGSAYWYAYKRVKGKLCKTYLGHTNRIDIALLETVARRFVEPEPVTPRQKTAPPPKPTFVFTRTLESALQIYGFSSILSRKALLARYRELSKQHHPDVGGLHEDMVAVNLAYDYLKRYAR